MAISTTGEFAYSYRFYFGGNRWTRGFQSHHAADLFGKEALGELVSDRTVILGIPILKIEYGTMKRKPKRLQEVPANLGHALLIDAAHAYIKAANWHKVTVCAAHEEQYVQAAAAEREALLVNLTKVSEYDPNNRQQGG